MRRLTARIILGLLVGFCSLSINTYAQGNFLYTNNNSGEANTVSAYVVSDNGVLAELEGSPFQTGGRGTVEGFFASNRITLVSNFLYASNGASNDVSGFSINPLTGNLTPLPGSPYSTGAAIGFLIGDISLAATPDGKYLMAGNSASDNISVYQIAANGTLSLIPGSPFLASRRVNTIKVSPDGKLLAVALTTDLNEVAVGGVLLYRIETNGSLTLIPNSRISRRFITGVEFHCAGTLLFVAEASMTTTVNVFRIDQGGGLTPIPGSPFTVNSGINSNVAILSSNDRFLFVSNQSSNSVTVLNVSSDGHLTLVPGSPFFVGAAGAPSGMATNLLGTLLYTAIHPHSISVQKISADGQLTLAPGSPISTGRPDGLFSLVAYPGKVCVQPFDLCIQDESSKDVLRINTTTGAYQITRCRDGFTIGGTGTLSRRGCTITLQDSRSDRRIMASIDTCSNRATASVQIFAQGSSFTLTDRNTTNNTCSCPNTQ
jgi:6-phosphogluconolactonase